MSAVYSYLQNWALDEIQVFEVDTTVSNMGRLNGACVLVEYKLDQNILLLVGRHHIYEVVLQGVFHEMNYPLNPIQIYLFSKNFKRTGIILIKIIFSCV